MEGWMDTPEFQSTRSSPGDDLIMACPIAYGGHNQGVLAGGFLGGGKGRLKVVHFRMTSHEELCRILPSSLLRFAKASLRL